MRIAKIFALVTFLFIITGCDLGTINCGEGTVLKDGYCVVEDQLFTITWVDTEGNILLEREEKTGTIPEFNLPSESDKWEYVDWQPKVSVVNKNQTYTAKRTIRESYFIGNVFQIIVYNLGNVPIATGTGYVFNEDGWFITNSHVMDDGYFASALFNIEDTVNHESFTKLEIDLASYNHSDKDIFIGKIDNYSIIGENYYHEIKYSTEYDYGDITFSVGYPNSSIDLEINQGYVQEDLTSIYEKVYGGISYIGSSSYIAPGSSGGILVNENLELLGMTTIGISDINDNFELGGSIEVFNFSNLLEQSNDDDLEDFAIFMHPDEKAFIGYFKEAMEHYLDDDQDVLKQQYEGYTRYIYRWEDESTNTDGSSYAYESTFTIDSDMWMEFEETYYWDSGDRKTTKFYGFWSTNDGIDNFTFDFKYEWSDGVSYTIFSNNINYSENINLTLNDYSYTISYGYDLLESNVEYAKENFNSIYIWLLNDIERFE